MNMTEVEKVLMGKGALDRVKHVPIERNWSGASPVIHKPFDPEQARENDPDYWESR